MATPSGAHFTIDLPDEVFARIEAKIEEAVTKALSKRLLEVAATNKTLSVVEVTERLKITRPTLRKMELDGRLVPSRVGRRVLYSSYQVDKFLGL